MDCISNYLSGNLPKHYNIDYVNVDINKDQKLFLDPLLIEKDNTAFGLIANRKISSYFREMYRLYKSNGPIQERMNLFSHCHEIPSTHLGYATTKAGSGNTPEGMNLIFSGVTNYIKNCNLKRTYEAVLFTPNFAEDGLSDLITNVIFKELSEFTISQCNKYGYPTTSSNSNRYYWDDVSNSWKKYTGEALVINGKEILLVPKRIVQTKYRFTTDNYIRSVIVENICKDKATYANNGKEIRPPKDKIREKLIEEYGSQFNVSTSFTLQKPDNLDIYYSIISGKYNDYVLSDDQLDAIIYSNSTN
ncbi:MAG: hypothetical protein ACLUFN_05310 [Eubacterium sp.]